MSLLKPENRCRRVAAPQSGDQDTCSWRRPGRASGLQRGQDSELRVGGLVQGGLGVALTVELRLSMHQGPGF